MFKKFIYALIILSFAAFLVFFIDQQDNQTLEPNISDSKTLITTFKKNTVLYSEDFIDQFQINSYMNEGWLGILIKKNEIYELHHFTMLNGEEYIDYDFDMSNVTELYICDGNLDFFVGEIIGADSKTYLKQFQIYVDTSFFEGKEITGSYSKGFIDVYEIDLNSVTDEIIYKFYAGSVDENTLIQTWHFNLKNE